MIHDPWLVAAVLSMEVMGRGPMVGLQYDHKLAPLWRAGAGVGRLGFFDATGQETAEVSTLIPLYFNYYLHPEKDSLFVTAGPTLILYPASTSGLESVLGGFRLGSLPLMGTLGIGYEARRSNGFVFRLSGYLIIGTHVKPWTGASFGYAF